MKAVRLIEDDHRSLAAVLHGMLYVVRKIRDDGVKPDFDLLGAMVYYIDAFPERLHHPKEDQYLFPRLAVRHPEAGPLIERLKMEHRAGAEKIRTLEQALTRYQQGGASQFSDFLAAVEAYAAFHWDHMRTEEKELLPLAEKYLTAADWAAIDEAFAGHTDPLFAEARSEDHHKVFQRILSLAPPPIGLGRLA